jgi:2-iminobutanoate/2-iminopropanoate deaminase
MRSLLNLSLVAALCASPLAAQQPQGAASAKQVFNAPNARPGVLSAAVKVGDILYVSGQLGTNAGALAEGGIQGQTRQALENVKSALALAGATMEDVVKCTVFLADVKDFQAMNQVYREFFPTNPPARSTVAVAGLVLAGAVVEIECIAAAKK